MYKLLTVLFLISFLLTVFAIPALADPFSDVPQDHWAYDAVQMLEEKGLVEGYPDGLFKGDRPMTRYEMAMVVARVIAKLEQIQASIPEIPDLSIYATKQDLETLNALLDEFRNELDALGVRVNNIEDSLGTLTSRVEELERVQLSGNINSTFVSTGLLPDDNNRSGVGTPNPNGIPPLNYGVDTYLNGFRLYEGTALMTKIQLNITARIADNVKAGGMLEAYSAFGDRGVADMWGLVPPYNSTGESAVFDNKFQANLSTLWFDTDGDWDVKGLYGDYALTKVSNTLFVGPRALFAYGGKVKLPLNGLNFSGTLYDTVDFEAFTANNINALQGFLDSGPIGGISPLDNRFAYGSPDMYHPLSNPTWYPLAVPYNNGAGSSHFLSYGQVDRGMYDNHLYGIWLGHDFLDDKAHIEGAYLNCFEDITSNPNFVSAGAPPKGTSYAGFKGHYIFGDDTTVKLFGEVNFTTFDYNIRDKAFDTQTGGLFDVGGEVDFGEFSVIGRFIRVDPNYDPFGFHMTWEKAYSDAFHSTEKCWTYGLCANATRVGMYRPNRQGVEIGADWFIGEEKAGHIYGDFAYFKQIEPTLITNDENTFQKFDFFTGTPVGVDMIGANAYGNQDISFLVNDPEKGEVMIFEVGGHYDFTEDLHFWADFERYDFSRDFANVHTNTANNLQFTQNDWATNFFYTGLTYDLTEKLSVQGNFAYVSGSGEKNAANIDWNQLIPGAGIRYMFSENTHFLIDYKYYSYSDETTAISGANDYGSNKLMTRVVINF